MTRTTPAERMLAAGGSIPLAKVRTGDRVFMLHAANEWIGVEVRRKSRDEEGALTVKVKVVYTDEIPGYELGDTLKVNGQNAARRLLTVDGLLGEPVRLLPADRERNIQLNAGYPMALRLMDEGARVFFYHSPGEWLGVELQAITEDAVTVKVVYTNEIPGYEVGEEFELDPDHIGRCTLTVDELVGNREEA